MGFFQQTGKFSDGGGDFANADDGIYICRLKEIETKQQPSFDDPSILEDKYVWVFEGANDEAQDDDGRPFRFVKYTKTNYGNDKAALTLLLDGMLGKRLTKEEYAALDIDDLTARKWRVNVELTTNSSGKDINKILWVKGEKAGGKKMGDMEANAAPPSHAPTTRAVPRPSPKMEKDDTTADPFE